MLLISVTLNLYEKNIPQLEKHINKTHKTL